MKRQLTLALTITVILGLTGAAFAAGKAGSSSDPLISLSYINSVLIPDVKNQTSVRVDTAYTPAYNAAVTKYDLSASALLAKISDKLFSTEFMNAVAEKTSGTASQGFAPRTFNSGDIITGALGTSFLIRSGTASVSGGALVNITAGAEVPAGSALNHYNRYMVVTENYPGIQITANNTVVEIIGEHKLPPPYAPSYTDLADALKAISLFRGADGGYELNRAANRLEALVMMIRLIGEENQALSFTGTHPFKDVPEWGNTYVAYAYSKGYTKGVSADIFATELPISPSEYLTYILRALGYNDSAGDFSWDTSIDKGLSVGLITTGESVMLKTGVFYRDQVVYLSYFSLECKLKDSNQTLLQKLIASGVMTNETASAALSAAITKRIG